MPGKRPSGRTPAGKGNGVGMGAGWGGPAKGAHPQRAEFTPETSAAANERRVEFMQTPEWWAQKANKEAVTAELNDIRLSIARDPRQPVNGRNAAMDSLDNRINGMPVARVVTAAVDDPAKLTDDQLEAELARMEGTSDRAAAGAAQKADPA